jgi:hypothetical protein
VTLREEILIAALPAAIFARYARAEGWPDWDPELRAASLPGGLVVGAEGWLQPTRGPRARFRVTEVRDNAGFTVEARLPLCRMQFGHDLVVEGAGTRVGHWVGFDGPFAWLFRRLIGRGLAAGLPATMAGLKAAVEAGT